MDIRGILTSYLGKFVFYQPPVGHRQLGRIKSFNDKYIFVVYHCDGNWENYTDYTAAATNPEDLQLLEDVE